MSEGHVESVTTDAPALRAIGPMAEIDVYLTNWLFARTTRYSTYELLIWQSRN